MNDRRSQRRHSGERGRQPRRGSVLVFVLVLIVVTTVAVLKFGERAMGEMAGDGYYVQRQRLRGEAYSALEATLAVLAQYREIDGGLYAPAQGWGEPLAEAGYEPEGERTVTVEFADENAKLSLRHAEQVEAALETLLASLGFEAGEVEMLTDSLLDWIDADDNTRPFGAEKDDYLRNDPAHVAANRPLRSFAELAAVQGFGDLMFAESGRPNERFEQFTRYVSLWSDGTVNLNTVPDDLLRASGLLDDRQLASLARVLDTTEGVRGTAGANYFRSLGELGDQVGTLPSDGTFSARCEVLSVLVTVRERQAAFRLRAVIRTDAGGTTNRSGAAVGTTRAAGGAASGGTASLEYPFQFLELVEDPPPSTIPPSQQPP